jgi:hypothetical protein
MNGSWVTHAPAVAFANPERESCRLTVRGPFITR